MLSARTVTSTGGSLSQAVAAGILSINDYHGGEIASCARQLGHIAERCDQSDQAIDVVAEWVLDGLKQAGERISGFGDRIHTNDPRTLQLFELAEAAGVNGPHMAAARAVERVFTSAGKTLPLNVNGAIAAVLADLGFETTSMSGLFVIARVPGLIAHSLEERTRQRPMRKIDPNAYEYDGPPPRSL